MVAVRPSRVMNWMLTVAEFFAGIGLVREGLEQAGWRVLFANDIDPKKQVIYEMNYGHEHFVLGDIYQLDASSVPNVLLATASFPCIDLSLAGNRTGLDGKHSSAIWGFMRLLRDMGIRRPPLVMLENVPGFLTSKGGRDFISVISALNDLGYRCDAFLVDAVHFVPQSRPRVFVVGALGDIMAPLSAQFHMRSPELNPRALVRIMETHRHLNWGRVPLPPLPRRQQNLIDILEDVPDNSPLWWPEEEVNKLLSQMADRHRAIAEAMRIRDHVSVGTVYRRVRNGVTRAELRVDGVAGALRVPRGGSSNQFLLVAGRGQIRVRVLTGREYARLQGVRDSYRLDGISDNHARYGFGDAVCVPVIRWIAEHCLNPLAKIALGQTSSAGAL